VLRRPVWLLLALAAALPGCTAQNSDTAKFSGEEQKVADTVEDLQTAGQDGDPRRICRGILAEDVVKKLEKSGSTCEKTIDRALDDADNYELEVKEVTVTGTSATAEVEAGAKNEKATLKLVKSGPDWRVQSLGPRS